MHTLSSFVEALSIGLNEIFELRNGSSILPAHVSEFWIGKGSSSIDVSGFRIDEVFHRTHASEFWVRKASSSIDVSGFWIDESIRPDTCF